MCGIFGFSGKYPADETKIRWLAIENQSRGIHSTGVYTLGLDKNETESLVKDAVTAEVMLGRHDFTQAIRGAGAIVGHTRAATWGVVSQANAHPFMYNIPEKVVGVHNGFVIQDVANSKFVGKDKEFEKTFDVDSMMIFALLSKYSGDYKKLSELEGAITSAFMVPDKYPGVIHLYARTARNLHFGFSKEGIYYSSDEKPLKLIGCSQITLIPNCHLVLLKDGQVLDIVETDPPKIKSIPLAASRTNWDDKVPQEEIAQYTELHYKLKRTNTSVTKQLGFGYNGGSEDDHGDYKYNKVTGRFQSEVSKKQAPIYSSSKSDSTADVKDGLIKEVEAEISGIAPITVIPKHTETDVYDLNDFKSCVLAIKLTSNIDQAPLPAWLIYDKAEHLNSAITMINGVTVMKFKEADCNLQRELILTDPVESNGVFVFGFKPESGRVMEVTLQLPFQQDKEEKEKSRSANESSIINRSREVVSGHGQSELSLLHDDAELNGGLAKITGDRKGGILEQASQLSGGLKVLPKGKSETSGDNGRFKEESRALCTINQRVHGEGKSLPTISFTPIAIQSIIETENNTFRYKDEQKKLINSSEYTKTCRIVQNALRDIIRLQIVNDATILKLHDKYISGNCRVILYYVIQILKTCPYRYAMNEHLNVQAHTRIEEFTTNYALGKLFNELEQEVTPEPKKFSACLNFTGFNPLGGIKTLGLSNT